MPAPPTGYTQAPSASVLVHEESRARLSQAPVTLKARSEKQGVPDSPRSLAPAFSVCTGCTCKRSGLPGGHARFLADIAHGAGGQPVALLVVTNAIPCKELAAT